MAVFTNLDAITEIIAPYKDTIAVAAVNAPEIIVLSGLKNPMNKIKDQLDHMNIYTTFMKGAQAFYSPVMELIIPEFEKFIREMNIEFHKPGIPLVSTVTGEKAPGSHLTNPRYWPDHMRSTIRFYEALNTVKQNGFQVFLEIGPTSTLTNLGKTTFPGDNALWLASLNKNRHDWQQLLHAFSQLYVHRVNLDWDKLAVLLAGKKVILPNYPMERKQFPLNLVNRQLSREEEAGTNMEMMERQLETMDWQLDLLSKKKS